MLLYRERREKERIERREGKKERREERKTKNQVYYTQISYKNKGFPLL